MPLRVYKVRLYDWNMDARFTFGGRQENVDKMICPAGVRPPP